MASTVQAMQVSGGLNLLIPGLGVTPPSIQTVIDINGNWVGQSISNAALDPALVQYATVALSSAQILALFTTPVTLIPAVAGKTIMVLQCLFVMTTTATAYAAGGNVTFQYSGGNAVTNSISLGVVTAGAGTSYTVKDGIDVTALNNTAVTIFNATGAFTTGTGTAVVNIAYRLF